MLAWYNAQLAARPVITQSWSSMILWGIGDIVAQKVVPPQPAIGNSKPGIDWQRVARFGLFGGLIAGPVMSNWYRVLDKTVNFTSANKTLFARVGLDQLAFAPCFISVIFSTLGFMEGKNVAQVKDKLQSTWWTALQNNWKLWPAVQLINFKLTPLPYRLLVVNTVSIGWNTYLSVLNSEGPPKKEGAIALSDDDGLELRDVRTDTGVSTGTLSRQASFQGPIRL